MGKISNDSTRQGQLEEKKPLNMNGNF